MWGCPEAFSGKAWFRIFGVNLSITLCFSDIPGNLLQPFATLSVYLQRPLYPVPYLSCTVSITSTSKVRRFGTAILTGVRLFLSEYGHSPYARICSLNITMIDAWKLQVAFVPSETDVRPKELSKPVMEAIQVREM